MKQFLSYIIVACALVFQSCQYKLKPFDLVDKNSDKIEICRYDRLESQYLTTSDFSALQQMNTDYPIETRTLIEDILKLGEVNDPAINKAFLTFYQDSALQTLISDAESQYANVDDLNKQFNTAFNNLRKYVPNITTPKIYMQIGALDQSIVIGNNTIGISIDKYLGKNYQLYKKYYPLQQRETMNRRNIVPDAICFYLMSLYPMHEFENRPQSDRDLHLGKIMWITNKVLEHKSFETPFVSAIEKYMHCNANVDIAELMQNDNYSQIKKFICYK